MKKQRHHAEINNIRLSSSDQINLGKCWKNPMQQKMVDKVAKKQGAKFSPHQCPELTTTYRIDANTMAPF